MTTRKSETSLRSLVSQVQLSSTDRMAGTIFYKQIFSYGTWINPNWWWDEELTMELDEALADSMIKNFNDKVYGKRISVPLNHTGDVNANTGEVVKLEKGEGGLYAYLDIKRPNVVEDINNGLIFDVSMGFDWDFVSQKDGKHYGPTLAHVALVTDPYLNDMGDFTESQLSKQFDRYAENTGFGIEQKSIIMMSKSKVEEFKRMKFAKIKNDKTYPVDVTYTNAEGKEVQATIEAGKELEVPTEAEEAVKTQVSESVEPKKQDDQETEAEKKAREEQEAADAEAAKKAEEDAETARLAEEEKKKEDGDKLDEGEKAELARLRSANAELSAKEAYSTLLAKGKITPAQQELFMALAKQGTMVKLSSEVKGMKLSKDKTTSITTMLSAILEAGPNMIKFGEKGGEGEDGSEVKLSEEQEEKLTRMGFSVDKFKKQLKAGTITMEDINNG